MVTISAGNLMTSAFLRWLDGLTFVLVTFVLVDRVSKGKTVLRSPQKCQCIALCYVDEPEQEGRGGPCKKSTHPGGKAEKLLDTQK